MSIVDDRMHLANHQARRERLWQTTDPTPLVTDPIVGAVGSAAPGAGSGRFWDGFISRDSAGDQLWQARIDLVVSSGLSGDAARKSRQDAVQSQSEQSFEAIRRLCQDELRPVLDCSVDMLVQWGLTARVTETIKDQPARVPRSFDLSLWIDRFGDRGPGKLTITATEGCDFVRVKVAVGPSRMSGDVNEHVGTTIAEDLSDAHVGGLVATLVEQIFSS